MGGQVTYLMSVVLLLAGIAVAMFATNLMWTGIDFIEYWTSNPAVHAASRMGSVAVTSQRLIYLQ